MGSSNTEQILSRLDGAASGSIFDNARKQIKSAKRECKMKKHLAETFSHFHLFGCTNALVKSLLGKSIYEVSILIHLPSSQKRHNYTNTKEPKSSQQTESIQTP